MKLAVDAIVFGLKERMLHLLLIRRKYPPFQDHWALPGGFVLETETLQEAVKRELLEETAADVHNLQHFGYYDTPNRDPRERILSIAYFGLVRKSQVKPFATTDAAEARWFPFQQLPNLAFDHAQIVADGLTALQQSLHNSPVGFNLLDEKFTLPELENIYQTILQKEIDRRNFRKKLASYQLLKEVGYAPIQGKGRPSVLYSFDETVYRKLEKEGLQFEI